MTTLGYYDKKMKNNLENQKGKKAVFFSLVY